jgi:hypothetical protein
MTGNIFNYVTLTVRKVVIYDIINRLDRELIVLPSYLLFAGSIQKDH